MKLSDIEKIIDEIRNRYVSIKTDGGEGSGNWGHEGRPGEIGGSAPGGGSHNTIQTRSGKLWSVAKLKKHYAKPSRLDKDTFDALPAGSIIITSDGKFKKELLYDTDWWTNNETGEIKEYSDFSKENVRVAVPEEFNTFVDHKGKKKDANYYKNNAIGKPGQYTAERKANAFRAESGEDADAAFRAASGEVYRELDYDTKKAFQAYTGSSYSQMNGILRNPPKITGPDSPALTNINVYRIKWMTEAIQKSELKEDTYLRRGVSTSSFVKMFKLDGGFVQNATEEDLQQLIGMEGTDDGFMSCGSSSDTGFTDMVNYEIYCPKGTKALYVEPFSENGNGEGIHWDAAFDGFSEQEYISDECETIVQRGTRFRITAIRVEGYRKYVSVDLIGQNPKKDIFSK